MKKYSFVNHKRDDSEIKYTVLTNYGLLYSRLDVRTFETLLQISIKDSKENPFPFDLVLEIALVTKFDEKELNRDFLETYLRFNSVSILFPYARSTITTLTNAAMVNQIVLPLINVADVTKNIDLTEVLKGI